jgi:hypothetical protein
MNFEKLKFSRHLLLKPLTMPHPNRITRESEPLNCNVALEIVHRRWPAA